MKGVPAAGPQGRDQRCGQVAAGVLLLWQLNLQDWQDSEWIRLGQAGGPMVPDSCCKTSLQHLQSGGRLHHQAGDPPPGAPRISGAVGLGFASVWVFSVPFTSCWYRSLKLERCCPCPREPALCVRRSSSRCGDY